MTTDKHSNTRDPYDFGGYASEIYTGQCKGCGRVIEVSTQEEICPEYYADVFVRCTCGDSVGFVLPVN